MPMKISRTFSLKVLIATLVLSSLDLHNLDAMFTHARIIKKINACQLNSSTFTHNPKLVNGAKYLALGIAVSTAWWLLQEDVDTDDNPKLEHKPDQEIIMRIFPRHKTSLGDNFYAGLLTFEGFEEGQVCLISDDTTPTFLCEFIHLDKTYKPSDFRKILDNDPTCPYPSHFHKQLNYLPDDAHLTILRQDKQDPIEVDLSPEIKDRLLKYLLHDLEDQERDCYDFFREILCKQSQIHSELFVSPANEQDLNPGDGVILFDFTKKPDEARHFAIALGDRLYVSRLGRGRPIFVTDMRTMLKLYECHAFGKASLPMPEVKKAGSEDTLETSGCTIF